LPPHDDASAPLEFARLVRPGAEEIAAIGRIYEEAIPPAERRATSFLAEAFGSPRYSIFVAREGGQILGFAVLFGGQGFFLLEYMAIHREHRARGIGGDLCRCVQADVLREEGAGVLLAEVEADDWDAPDLDVRRKRKRFYRRLGFKDLAGLGYILPLPGAEAMEPMHLMVCGVEGDRVARDAVYGWVSQIYAGVYGCGPRDPRLARTFASVGDEVAVL